jgi:hypothetical protein
MVERRVHQFSNSDFLIQSIIPIRLIEPQACRIVNPWKDETPFRPCKRRKVMSIYGAITRFVATQRARRLHIRTAMRIADLPLGMQKDIGWPDGVDFDRDFRSRS